MTMSKVFQTRRGRLVPPATVKNRAGGPAYQFSDEQALIQKAVTCTFNGTFYATAQEHLDEVMELCSKLDPKFVAQVAMYSRRFGYMKDMPAYLVADLAAKVKQLNVEAQDAWDLHRKAKLDGDPGEIDRTRKFAQTKQSIADETVRMFRSAFKATMSNGIMLKKFAHVLRSGVTGRKSFGSAVKRTVQDWLNWRSPDRLFRDSVGGDVTLADLIKLARPKAIDAERNALYRYLIGKETEFEALPALIRQYEWFKDGKTDEVPDVEFRHLTGLPRANGRDARRIWTEIARNAPWHRTRMNLNTFTRHGVFNDPEMVDMVAKRLADPKEVRSANVMPYQLLAAYLATRRNEKLPRKIQGALHDALEIACENIPEFEGPIHICVDISGSMTWTPVTGQRDGQKSGSRNYFGYGHERYDTSSKIMCVHAAALIASAIMRKNPESGLIPYDHRVYRHDLDPRDTIMTNADKLAAYGGGGTDCSLPLRALNQSKAPGKLVIYISDYESWVDWGRGGRATAMAVEWAAFKSRNPGAKLVCIDLSPRKNCQVPDSSGVLNVGGFSDKVFDVVQAHVDDRLSAGHVVDIVKGLDLPDPVFRPWTQGGPGGGNGKPDEGDNGVTRGKWFESGDGRRARAYAREKGVRLHRLWSGNAWRALYAGTKLPKDVQRRVDNGSMKLKLIEV